MSPKEYHFINTDIPKTINDSLIVDGYGQRFSFNQEDSIGFFINAKIKSTGSLGIYDVNGKLIDYFNCDLEPQKIGNSKPYENGYGYKQTKKYFVPTNLKSGLYYVGNKIPFLVKNSAPNQKAKILFVHPSNTDIAYNNNGGKSYYFPSTNERARVLSKLRPWQFPQQGNLTEFYKWVKLQALDIDYIADEDLEDYQNIQDYQLIIIAGHSEYWSRNARLNFDKFINNGNNALILSGCTMYWQIRYDNPLQQICYKYDAISSDPINNILLKTASWENTKLKFNQINSIGLNYYTNGGFSSHPNGFKGYKIIQPQSIIFKNTDLLFGDIIKFNGWEYDGTIFKYGFNKNNPSIQIPIYNNDTTKFNKVQILAYDWAVPDYGGNNLHMGAILALQKQESSGIIINIGASNWCAEIKKKYIAQITNNCIVELQKNSNEINGIFIDL